VIDVISLARCGSWSSRRVRGIIQAGQRKGIFIEYREGAGYAGRLAHPKRRTELYLFIKVGEYSSNGQEGMVRKREGG
jgi:hypothetical protein